MISGPTADLFICRIGGQTGGVAHLGRIDAGDLPEQAFRAPETAEAEHGGLQALRKRRHQRVAVDEMLVRHGHRFAAPRKGVAGGGELCLGEEHGSLSLKHLMWGALILPAS